MKNYQMFAEGKNIVFMSDDRAKPTELDTAVMFLGNCKTGKCMVITSGEAGDIVEMLANALVRPDCIGVELLTDAIAICTQAMANARKETEDAQDARDHTDGVY